MASSFFLLLDRMFELTACCFHQTRDIRFSFRPLRPRMALRFASPRPSKVHCAQQAPEPPVQIQRRGALFAWCTCCGTGLETDASLLYPCKLSFCHPCLPHQLTSHFGMIRRGERLTTNTNPHSPPCMLVGGPALRGPFRFGSKPS